MPCLRHASVYAGELRFAIVSQDELGTNASHAYRGTVRIRVPSGPTQFTISPPRAEVYPPQQVFGFLSTADSYPNDFNRPGRQLVKQGSSEEYVVIRTPGKCVRSFLMPWSNCRT